MWDAQVASVAALFADRARARMLVALIDGRSLPASRLAAEAGVTPATASSHLGRLVEAHLLAVESSGRHRFYRLADERAARVIEDLAAMTDLPPITSLRDGTRANRLRTARSCYDHIAGRLGVAIMRALVADGVLVPVGHAGIARRPADPLSAPLPDRPYALGSKAADGLAAWGVDLRSVEAAGRPTLRFCMDWTEQCHHLGGGLGAALLTSARGAGWLVDGPRRRELVVTDAGREFFDRVAAQPDSAASGS
ncbi:winged helix-turn-helix transcriptional regulator [Calidifontibacter sp. DB0510]|uniref:Winged helix-turn-helix transcriptional regulator n=1 Tax=Metallococcus carri TaxID=1656884 RepID=A0A967AWE8_9MICO|nr:winged helix-turn-helix domain-containing protein [Metallococcus carri]NHN54194.1 winged helix-turn-helix transcriptional regulator [Metallococcus carri]NOP36966.1 winged helix-turn-helix transcriptional regulator [Calidifontibacter sp. DB2511S]